MKERIGDRVTVERSNNRIEVVVPAEPDHNVLEFFVLFTGVSILFWAFAVYALSTGAPAPIIVVSAAIWAVAYACLAYSALWVVSGKEILTVADGEITLGRSIWGFTRTSTWPVSRASYLRSKRQPGEWRVPLGLAMIMAEGPFWFWFIGVVAGKGEMGGSVAFDVGKKTVRFGVNLNGEDAAAVIEMLTPFVITTTTLIRSKRASGS